MRTAVMVFFIGVILLFVGSITLGRKALPPAWRELNPVSSPTPGSNGLGPDEPPEKLTPGEYKKLKITCSSFDLMAGLTKKEIENLPEHRGFALYTLFPFKCNKYNL
ncbi:MAG: hypothetical protein FJ126_09930 [Deltaproteobacteria bacterium]|nr:hypothetical protein [Deltaproteobacteria bacterium]